MNGRGHGLKGLLLGVSFLLAGLLNPSAHADEKRTFSDLQGAYIVKFARYATWLKPDPALPADQFVIGVVGQNPFGNLLDGETVDDKPIRIVRFEDDAKNIGPCHVLYINLQSKAAITACLKNLNRSGMLTVSDHPDFLNLGGMIRFVLVNDRNRQRVRWIVNATPAGAAGINLGMEIQRFALKKGAGR